jgi:hypothetical protein
MVEVLDTVDNVGLVRPACQEFHLPKDMLSGKISGANQASFGRQRLQDHQHCCWNIDSASW